MSAMLDLFGASAQAVYEEWRLGLSDADVAEALKRNALGSYPTDLSKIKNPGNLTEVFWRRNVTLFEVAARKQFPREVPTDPLAFWEFELRCHFLGVDLHVGTQLRVRNKSFGMAWP